MGVALFSKHRTHVLPLVVFVAIVGTLLANTGVAGAVPTSKTISLNGGFSGKFQIAVDSAGNVMTTRALVRKYQVEYFTASGRRVNTMRRAFSKPEWAPVRKYFVGDLHAGALSEGVFMRAVISPFNEAATVDTTRADGKVIATKRLELEKWSGFTAASTEGLGGAVAYHAEGIVKLIRISAEGAISEPIVVTTSQGSGLAGEVLKVALLPLGGYAVVIRDPQKQIVLARVSGLGIVESSVVIPGVGADADYDGIEISSNLNGQIALYVDIDRRWMVRLIQSDGSVSAGVNGAARDLAVGVLQGADGTAVSVAKNAGKGKWLAVKTVVGRDGSQISRTQLSRRKKDVSWMAASKNGAKLVAAWSETKTDRTKDTTVYYTNVMPDGSNTKPKILATNPKGRKGNPKWVATVSVSRTGNAVVGWHNSIGPYRAFLANGQFRFAR